MGQAKVQHYVPRFLLRKFAEKDQIHVFEKQSGRVFRANVKNVAAESRFYDFEVDGQSHSMEPGLSKIEGMAGEIIGQILKTDSLAQLTIEERTVLSFFFALQQVRTRTFREMFRSLPILLRQKLLTESDTPERLAAIEEYIRAPNENELTKQTAHFIMQSVKDFVPLYLGKDWILAAADLGEPFQIGDNPISFQNQATRPSAIYGNIGLALRGIEVYCPLTPTRAIAIWCTSLLGDIRNATNAVLRPEFRAPLSNVAREVLHAADSGEPLLYRHDNVLNFNSLQVAYSERYVFSSNGDFALARDMVGREPGLRNGPRIQMG